MQKDHTTETVADELKAATDEWEITLCLSETDLSEMKHAITLLQPFQEAT